jgi:nucleoside-diphosphate-sugar epimerase
LAPSSLTKTTRSATLCSGIISRMVARVLLTGGNGFVGAHILEQLLAKNFHVRSVVRSQAKADQVRADHPNAGNKLDFFIVPNITSAGAFDEAVKSTPPFDTIIHTASPFLFRAANDNLDFLRPAILGTTELLKATKAFAPEVKRVIVTSSFAAVIDSSIPQDAGKIYTWEDWNPVSWEEALTVDPSWAYRASKKFAEKAGTLQSHNLFQII